MRWTSLTRSLPMLLGLSVGSGCACDPGLDHSHQRLSCQAGGCAEAVDRLVAAYDAKLRCRAQPDTPDQALLDSYLARFRADVQSAIHLTGSNITADDLTSYAAALEAADCRIDLALVGVYGQPLRGTQGAGSSCTYGLQCQSGQCDGGGPASCGACAAVQGEGDPCDDQRLRCGAGLTCQGTCVRLPGGPNTVCQRFNDCQPGVLCIGHRCVSADQYCQAVRCDTPAKAGEDCTFERCSLFHACDDATHRCVPMRPVPVGEGCTVARDATVLLPCANGYCSLTTGRCEQQLLPGQPCDDSAACLKGACVNSVCVVRPACPAVAS